MESLEEVFESLTGDRVLTFELEAAEALAGLACSSSRYEIERRCCTSKLIEAKSMDQATGVQQFSENTSTVPFGPVKNADTFYQTRVTNHPSKVSGTSRQKLSEAEKETQRLHRILANRESARQTIRRRQAMHLELTAKAASLMAENVYLTKEKELAMKKYNCLKDERQFLQVQVAKRKQSEPEETRNPCSKTYPSAAATATTSSTQPFLQNQPSLFPFMWPSHFPSSEHVNPQGESSSDRTNGSQSDIPTWDEFYRSILVQKCYTGVAKPPTPVFILPIPCLVPFNTHCYTHESCPAAKDSQKDSSLIHECRSCSSLATLMHENYHQLSSHQKIRAAVDPSSSRVTSTSYNPVARLNFSSQGGNQSEVFRKHPGAAAPATASKHMRYSSLENTCRGRSTSPSRKPSDIGAATEARKKRKELMRLRNAQGHDSHLP